MGFSLDEYDKKRRGTEDPSAALRSETEAAPRKAGGGFSLDEYHRQKTGGAKSQTLGNLPGQSQPREGVAETRKLYDGGPGLMRTGLEGKGKAVVRPWPTFATPWEEQKPYLEATAGAQPSRVVKGLVEDSQRELDAARAERDRAEGAYHKVEPGGYLKGKDSVKPSPMPYAAGLQARMGQDPLMEEVRATREGVKTAKDKLDAIKGAYTGALDREREAALPADLGELRQKIADTEAARDRAQDKADALNIELSAMLANPVDGQDYQGKMAEYKKWKAEYEAQEEELSYLSQHYSDRKNTQRFDAMRADWRQGMRYSDAKTLEDDLQKLTAVLDYDAGGSGADGTDVEGYRDALMKKYGLGRSAFTDYTSGTGGGPVAVLYETLNERIRGMDQESTAAGYDNQIMRRFEQQKKREAEDAQRAAQLAQFAEEHPVAASGLSVPLGLGDAAVGLLRDWGTGQREDPDHYLAPERRHGFSSVVRGTVSKKIERETDWNLWGRNVGSFLYQTGMSAADNAALIATLGPGAGYVMGLNAAVSTAGDVVDRGGTREQAFWGGLAAGVAEMLFERVSIENLLTPKNVTNWKGVVWAVLKQSGVEASEEFCTEIANILSDTAIMGANSNFANAVRDYQAQGMTAEQAQRQAYLDQIGQVVEAAAGGAISGGMMSGGQLALDYAGNSQQWKLNDLYDKAVTAYQKDMKDQERLAREAEVLRGIPLTKSLGAAGRTGLTNAIETRLNQGAFTEELDPLTLAEGYQEVYLAGLNGVELEPGGVPLMAGPNAGRLSPTERMQAYSNGVNDAKARVEQNKRRAKFATVAGAEKGLVWDEYVERQVDAQVADRMNEVAKRLGVRVVFQDDLAGGLANGQIVEADIRIAKDADQPVMVVFGHEVGHWLEETAPEAYQTMRKFTSQRRMTEIEARIQEYQAVGRELSFDDALREYANDDIGRMIADPNVLQSFIEANKNDRNLLQKVADAFRALWQKLTGKDRQQVKTAEEALLAALKASEAQAAKLERAGQVMDFGQGQQAEGVEYSIKRTRTMDWESQVKGWFAQDGSIKSSDSLYLGESETWLEGVPTAPLYVPGSVMTKATRAPKGSKSGHSLTQAELAQMPARIKSAPAVIVNPSRNALIYVTDMVDSHGWPVVAAFNMNNDLYGETAHGATSIYGRESGLGGLFGNLGEDATIFVRNKSKFDALLSGTGKSYPQLLAKVKFADGSVAQEEGGVKPEFSLKSQSRGKALEREGEELQTRYEFWKEQAKALDRENEELRAKYDFWKKQTRRSDAGKVSEEAVGRYVRSTMRDFGIKGDEKGISMKLLALYDGMSSGTDADGGELVYRDFSEMARKIAGELVANAVAVDSTLYDDYAELRAYIRRTPIVVDAETRAGMADYEDFRRGNMGRLRLKHGETGNIDQVYTDLARMWSELFPEEIAAEQDQLERIAQVMGQVYAREEINPFGGDLAGATEAMAHELLEQFWDIPGEKATYADRQWRLRQEMKRQHESEIKTVIRAEREKGKVNERNLKEWFKARDARDRARKAESEARNRLLKLAARMKRMPVDGTNKALIQELIGELDTEARHLTGKKLAELTELRRFCEAKADPDSESYDPDFILDAGTAAALKRLEMKHIDDMTLQDVQELTKVLLNLEHEIRTSKRLVGEQEGRDIYQLAEQVENDVRTSKGAAKGGVAAALDKYIVTETLSPLRQVRRMVGYKEDSPLVRLTEALADGQRKMLDYQMRAEKPFERFANDRAFSKRFSGKDAETVKIQGMVQGRSAEVEVTRAMMVSLWLHSQNDQNALHMRDGGVRVPDMGLYRKGKLQDAYAAGTVVKVSPALAKGLWAQMTKTEREFARAAQDYFGKVSKPAINEVSNILKGYDLAEVENYFPIQTDKTFGKADLETLKFDGTIEGMGFLKGRMSHAHSPMVLEDANSVLEQAIRMHGKYVGLAIPVRNFGKVWNVSTAARVKGAQKTASTGEAVKVQSSGVSALEGADSLGKTLASNIDALRDMGAVAQLTGQEMNDRTKRPSEQIRDFFSKVGSVIRHGFGEVAFGEYGVGGMLNHRPLNRAKMVTLEAVPQVIENGRIISDVDNWKGRGYRSVVFAAPVMIGESQVYVAAVVNQNPDGKFYLSECVDSEGNYIRIEDNSPDDTKSGVTAQGGVTATPDEVALNQSIPQSAQGVKWSSYGDSVQNAIQAVWGPAGYNYLVKLMTDLQGGGKDTAAWAKALRKVRSNYAGAVLTLNASVAMKQAASYPTAAAVLGWKPLAQAMKDFGKVDLDLIAKYTPVQAYRSKGFSTRELGDIQAQGGIMKEVLSHKALNWVQGVDLLTTRKLWKASEYYVRDNSPKLAAGSDAYYKAVAEVYNRVIEETQPNYTTMQRPQMLRSDSSIIGELMMFKTQPFQNFNILYDAAGEYRAVMARLKAGEATKAQAQAARQKLNRAVTSQVAQLGVFAGMTMLWGMFRGRKDKYDKDGDGEIDLFGTLEGLGKDMVGGAATMVPWGSEVWEFASSKLFGDRYYGVEPVGVGAITDTASSLSKMGSTLWDAAQSAIRGENVDWKGLLYQLDDCWDDVSKTVGLPHENVVNLFNAFARWGCIAAQGEYMGEYAAMHLTTNAEKDQGAYMDLLYRAMDQDPREFDKLYAQMMRDGFDAKKVRTAMEARMKKGAGVEKVSELDQRFLAPREQRDYDAAMKAVKRTDLWSEASRKQRDAVGDDLYEFLTRAGGEARAETWDAWETAGFDGTTYALYQLAREMTDQPNKSGKLGGSPTNEEREDAIALIPGLTVAEKAALWELAGGKETSNPWG